MKRNFLFWMMAALAAASLAFVGCQKPDEPEDNKGNTEKPEPGKPGPGEEPGEEAPVFPEAVSEALEAGGTYTLELQPNVDWRIELKYDSESTGWFWIKDGNSQVYSLRGKAGEKVAVTVCAGDQTDFDTVHSCTLEMTMGEETKTIATFTRGTVERTFTLAYCKVEEDGSDYVYSEPDSDLKYDYNEVLSGDKPEIPLEWLIRTKDFRRSVLIAANFDWRLKSKPEWLLDLKITDGLAGQQVEFDLEGDPVLYPVEDAEAELVFCAKENPDAVYAFTVKIPGCGDIFSITGFQAETKANKAGEIWNTSAMDEGSWIPAELGVSGSILGLDGVKVYTFAYAKTSPFDSEKMWDSAEENTEWITTTLSEWSDEAGVIQERMLNITLAENTSEEREAYIFAIPAADAPEYAHSIFPDGQNMDAKYEKYVVTRLVQEGVQDEPDQPDQPDQPDVPEVTSSVSFVTPDAVVGATLDPVTKSNLADMIAKYPNLTGELKENVEGMGIDVVVLTYTSATPENVALSVPAHKWIDAKPGAEGPEWLTYETKTVNGKKQLTISMTKPVEGQPEIGILNFFESYSSSTQLAIIYCIPEF